MDYSIAPANVRELIDTELDDAQLVAFAMTSQEVCLAAWKRVKQTPPIAIARAVIGYLAAHFCALREPPVLRENLPDGVSIQYDANSIFKASAKGLLATVWGQTAVALDPTGALNDMTMGPIPRAYILNGLAEI